MKQYKYDIESIKKLAKQMIILIDSREKQNQHILSYFDKQGIAYKKEKLDYGDYSFLLPSAATGQGDIFFHNDIVIERKGSLEELSGNLAQERERFEKEFLTARNNNAKIYLMVEAPEGYSGIAAHNYHTELTPSAYMASLKTFEHRFDMNVQFISPEYAGYYIYSTFFYFCREVLR